MFKAICKEDYKIYTIYHIFLKEDGFYFLLYKNDSWRLLHSDYFVPMEI